MAPRVDLKELNLEEILELNLEPIPKELNLEEILKELIPKEILNNFFLF
jgi:hypothetical protein